MLQSLREFGRKKLQNPGNDLRLDMHGHWLPGIDDGAADVSAALGMLASFSELGYIELIATPHIYRDYYPNTEQTIHSSFERIRTEADKFFPHLTLGCAAEYYLDDHFESLLRAKSLLTFQGNHVLVEQGYFAETPGVDKYLFDIQIKGYAPVLAHPERYVFYHQNNKKIAFMRELGIKMQINLLSLTGKYGPVVASKAMEYLEKGWVDFIGTDAHTQKDIQLCREIRLTTKAYDAWLKISGKTTF
jgi:protein-tyrosine phosphatase